MNSLLKLFVENETTKPLSYDSLKKVGWDQGTYLRYVDLCVRLQAAVIVYDEKKASETYNHIVSFLCSKFEMKPKSKWDPYEWLKSQVRIITRTTYFNDSRGVYLPFDDFRCIIESVIRRIMIEEEELNIIDNDDCTEYYNNSVETNEKIKREYEWELADLEEVKTIEDKDFNSYEALFSFLENEESLGFKTMDLEEKIGTLEDVIKIQSDPSSFIPTKSVLYISKGRMNCYPKKHSIICKTAILHDIDGKEIEINVNYCENCQKHFLKYEEYEEYISRYGSVFGKMILCKDGEFTSRNYYELSDTSPLMLNGYTVSQYDDYSEIWRQKCLQRIIDLNILHKHQVIDYLNSFISRNGRRSGNELAVSKWRSDLDFVREYNMDSQARVKITGVERYNSK